MSGRRWREGGAAGLFGSISLYSASQLARRFCSRSWLARCSHTERLGRVLLPAVGKLPCELPGAASRLSASQGEPLMDTERWTDGRGRRDAGREEGEEGGRSPGQPSRVDGLSRCGRYPGRQTSSLCPLWGSPQTVRASPEVGPQAGDTRDEGSGSGRH